MIEKSNSKGLLLPTASILCQSLAIEPIEGKGKSGRKSTGYGAYVSY
ncbi:MAG: hypothetical protein V3V31_00335 [Methylococcales bacterium]